VTRSTQQKLYDLKMKATRRSQVDESSRLSEIERRTPEELAQLQRERALVIARHAFERSPFYRDLYSEAGLTTEDFRDPAVLDHLPFAQKAAVRESFDAIRTPEATPENTAIAATGGSTGHPTKVLHDKRALQHLIAYRLHSWWGVAPSDNRALVWRMGYQANPWKERLGNVATWPMKVLQLDANQMGQAEVARFFDRWAGVRPVLLSGYVGALLELARIAQEDERSFAPPLAIAATSAPISAGQKAYLSEVFGAPTYDHYQSIEVPIIAGECAEADGQHVFTDARWLEIVDDSGRPVGPGETGIVAVTDLRNRAFPIVRYVIGDRASWKTGPCPCGRPFPRINPVGGRTTDNLRLPSGLVISGAGMTAIFDPWPDAVRQFQVVQRVDSSITLRCVRGDSADADAIMQRVADRLRTTVRGEVPVRLEVVDDIPHDRGKSRFIVRESADGTTSVPSIASGSGDSGSVAPELIAQRAASSDSTSRSSPVATS
jgi:phenylacetate-CoA ligase